MKKTKPIVEAIEAATLNAGDAKATYNKVVFDPVAFGPDTVWIGGSVLKRLVERTAEQYADDQSVEEEDGSLGAGLRQVEAVLGQFQDVTGMRVRLIFGPPSKPLHELDVFEVPTVQGEFANDDIQRWLEAGASLFADARDLCFNED